jgi:hypothetical protein
MPENNEQETVSVPELIGSALHKPTSLAKLLIEKGFFTNQEFLQKVSEERATYQKMFNPTGTETENGIGSSGRRHTRHHSLTLA